MSDPRRLWMRFRPVPASDRERYRRAATTAGETASALGAHFWAFELDEAEVGGGGCIEFLEGPDDAMLGSLDRVTEAALRAAAGGAGTSDLRVGAEGLRSTEIR